MFLIESDGQIYDTLAVKSRRGVDLICYLILQQGKSVSSQRLVRELWSGRRSESPENALKTLVSRTRAMLNEISQGLGGCIASVSGGYKWDKLPGVTVDVLEILDIFDKLRLKPPDNVRRMLSEELLRLYRGDLDNAEWLHKEYLDAVYDYLELLKRHEDFNHFCEVCDQALQIDELDEQLRILRIEGMMNLNQVQDAMAEYRRVTRQSMKELGENPSEQMKACYEELSQAGRTVRFNLDVIHNELVKDEAAAEGPYMCDYPAFREIYNIQINNLERLGSTMFLGVIMLEAPNNIRLAAAMAGLQEILSSCLRKGDIVTRFKDNMFSMLLPTVNYATGGTVMERIEHIFYSEYDGKNVFFHARISPLGRREM